MIDFSTTTNMSDVLKYPLCIPPMGVATEKRAEDGIEVVVPTKLEGIVGPHRLNFVVHGLASKQHAESWILNAMKSVEEEEVASPRVMLVMHKLTDVNELDHGMLPDHDSDLGWQPEESKRRQRIV
jgi:hypothetical protein